jgi:hypothetical protein
MASDLQSPPENSNEVNMPNDKTQELLTMSFARSLPGGALDDATYETIEIALDRLDAPMTAPDGR